MTQDNPPSSPAPGDPQNPAPESNEYDLKPSDKPATPARPKPGDPDFVAPVPIIETAESTASTSPEPAPIDPDVEQNKAMAILAYILFVIPLIAAPKSSYARFHANQGLILFILWCISMFIVIVGSVAYSFLYPHLWSIAFVRFMLGCMCTVVVPGVLIIGCLALTVVGIINAANGERKGLPLIGHLTLLK